MDVEHQQNGFPGAYFPLPCQCIRVYTQHDYTSDPSFYFLLLVLAHCALGLWPLTTVCRACILQGLKVSG